MIMCDDETLLCATDNTTTTLKKEKKNKKTMRLQPNCSAEIATSVVDPDKAAFNMNQFGGVHTGSISRVRSGGVVRLGRWRGACYLDSNV